MRKRETRFLSHHLSIKSSVVAQKRRKLLAPQTHQSDRAEKEREMTDEDEKRRKQKERLERVKGLLEAKKKKEMEEKDYVKKSEKSEEKSGGVRGIGANPSFLAPRGNNNKKKRKKSCSKPISLRTAERSSKVPMKKPKATQT